MLIKEKKIYLFIVRFLKIALAVFIVTCIFVDPLRSLIFPPLKDFVHKHINLLVHMVVLIFIICTFILLLILVALEKEYQRMRSLNQEPDYKSELVAKDYFEKGKSFDYYKAIRTLISRYRKGPLGDSKEDEFQSKIKEIQREPELFQGSRTMQYLHAMEKKRSFLDRINPFRKKDGVVSKHYPNGKIKAETRYKKGRIHGTYRSYYADGTLHQEIHYSEGRLNGLFRAYDENSVLFFERNYKDGKQVGIENVYYPNGVLHFRDTYRNGVKINKKTYSQTGQLEYDHDYTEKLDEIKNKSVENS